MLQKFETKSTKKKTIEDKPNNQSKATILFDDLIDNRKEIMQELHDSFDYNNLKFEYVGSTENVSFYEYIDSKELFNAIKNDQIRFDEAIKIQDEFLNKLSNIKIGKKNKHAKRSDS